MEGTKELLQSLLDLGLIEVGENTEAFQGIVAAADDLAQRFLQSPSLSIASTLVALDKNAPVGEPSFKLAKEAATSHWPTFSNRFKDEPRQILRMILFAALDAASQTSAQVSAIIWLTSENTFPYLTLGKEGEIFRARLAVMAERAEAAALNRFLQVYNLTKGVFPSLKVPEINAQPVNPPSGYNDKLVRAVGPHPQGGDQNPQFPAQAGNVNWSQQFAPRMAAAIAELVNQGVEATTASGNAALKALSVEMGQYLSKFEEALKHVSTRDSVRVDAIWWSEALFSASLRRGYRELHSESAALAMACDLHQLVGVPAPVSVSYFLRETAVKALGTLGNTPLAIRLILENLKAHPEGVDALLPESLSTEGRLPLLDLVSLATKKPEAVEAVLRGHTGFDPKLKLTAAEFAAMCLRDFQARSLAHDTPESETK